MNRYYRGELRKIDAVRNESFVLADDIVSRDEDLTPRKVMNQVRKWGYLPQRSKVRVRVEILDASTGRPILDLLVNETI